MRLRQTKSKESQEEERYCCPHVGMDRNNFMIINEVSDFIFVHVSLIMTLEIYSRKVILKIIECNMQYLQNFILCSAAIISCLNNDFRKIIFSIF